MSETVFEAARTVPCSRCGSAMQLTASLPKLGPHPELRTYRCPRCSHVDTIEDAADKGR